MCATRSPSAASPSPSPSAGRPCYGAKACLFTGNGIAGAQAPLDDIKALGAPLAEAANSSSPSPRSSHPRGTWRRFFLQAYDQLEWRRDRLPGVGSYFSTTDILDAGGQRDFGTGGMPTLYRGADDFPHGVGQFGVALLRSDAGLDWGLYALRADTRAPSVITYPADDAYHLAFARGIQVFGASASTYAGAANVAGEISLHRDTPLVAVTAASPGESG